MFLGPGTTAAKILYQSAITFGTKLIVDSSEKLSSDINLDSKEMKKVIQKAAISAAEKLTRKTLISLIPGANITNDALSLVVDQITNATVEATVGVVSERLKYGKWYPQQIIPRIIISAVFNSLKVDVPSTKILLEATKSATKNLATRSTHEDSSIKQFLKGTRTILDENYLKDKETFGELKKLADNDPEAYNEMMINVLKQVLEEHSEKD